MKEEERHEIMKQCADSRSQIVELGKQLGLNARQIRTILNETQHNTEHLSFSLGPPHYGSGFYGTVSINDFSISKK